MLVTNKNQTQPHNEGFGSLTYWRKLNTIIAHFPTSSIAEETAFVFAVYINIHLPTYFANFIEHHKIKDEV